MPIKSKKTIALFITCAALAIAFFVAIFTLSSIFEGDNGDPYENATVDTGMVFDTMSVDIVWDKDRSCEITQKLDVTFRTPSHGIYVDIPVNSGEKIRGIDVVTSPSRDSVVTHESGNDIVRIRIGDEDKLFRSGETLNVTVSYECRTPEHPSGPDILAFNAIGKGWTADTKSAVVTMTYPEPPEQGGTEYGIWLVGRKDEVKIDGNAGSVSWSNGGKTVKIVLESKSGYALPAFTGVNIAYKMPDGTLNGGFDIEFIITLVLGLILVALVISVKFLFAKDKPLTPIVDYYPPRIDAVNGEKRHMLPVQMGKIIDNVCSADDVTSLIFYWASEGYIEIEDRTDGTYFKKLKELEPVTDYERKLFDKIFSYGKTESVDEEKEESVDIFPEYSVGDEKTVKVSHKKNYKVVSLEKLKGKLADTVSATAEKVNRAYNGKLYKSSFTTLATVMSVLCALYAIGITVFTSLRVGAVFNLFGIVSIIPVLLSAVLGSIICKYRYKLPIKKKNALTAAYVVLTVALAFAVSLSMPIDVTSTAERIIFAICLALASVVSPFISVRTDEYTDNLNSILGFRDFLRDAEKDRLETLLESDPQYYYNILPYANVLGVSDIWEHKFEALKVEPPTYYRSYRGDVFDILVMHSLFSRVRSDIKYVPPSSPNKGSFSGGFGGGHGGGGGFSGGSFGGGGGGRW